MADPPRLIVPPLERRPWPTLGPEICDWLEAHVVHGPGDVLGKPVRFTEEDRLFLYRAYEVAPKNHALAGRRRFKRVALSRRKGWHKTELAAFIAIAEMDPTAPVRFDGWRREGGEWIPVGRPILDPYIPMVATTEEQTEDLAYGAVHAILEHCDLGNEYVIGNERILHRLASGVMKPLASAPSAREGARTSFEHFDETHKFTPGRLKDAHATMLRNLPKRLEADAWALETSTMYDPSEDSVAQDTHRFALQIARGQLKGATLYFDHRQASEEWNIDNPDELVEAIREASGDAWEFTDVDGIIQLQFRDPTVDENEARRYWLNQKRKSTKRWMPTGLWERLGDKRRRVPKGKDVPVVLGFDGSYKRDSTALVGCTVEARPHIFLIKAWEKPLRAAPQWRVSRTEVDDEVAQAMEEYAVLELAPDPPGWHREIEGWEATFGEVVVRFDTNQPSRFGPACDSFFQAVADGDLTQDASEVLERHVDNCVARNSRGYSVIQKSDPDSPDKIDGAVAAVVAHERARWHFANPQEDEEDLGAILVDTTGTGGSE